MTAEEIARVVADMIRNAYRVEVTDTMERTLTVIVEKAEDEALERAAEAVEAALSFHSYAGGSAAAVVRGLKSPSTPGGDR